MQMFVGYFNKINFGIPYSAQLLMLQNKDAEDRYRNVFFNSLIVNSLLIFGVIIIAVLIGIWPLELFGKYDITWQFYVICLIAALDYYNMLFLNVFRVTNQIFEVAFQQSIFPLLKLSVVFFAKDSSLVNLLLFANLGSVILPLLLFIIRNRIQIKTAVLKLNIVKEIIVKGWYLFIYNCCFFLILLVLRTIVSKYYTVEEFGNFNFAYSLSNAILLLVDAVAFLLYPKLLSVFSSHNLQLIKKQMLDARSLYLTLVNLLMYLALLFFPIIQLIFTEYKYLTTALSYVAMIIMMSVFHFGYSTFLIAQKMEKQAALTSIVSLVINVIGGVIIAKYLKAGFQYVMLAPVIAHFTGALLCFIFTCKKIHLSFLKDFFSYRIMGPFFLYVIFTIWNFQIAKYLVFILFIILNISEIKKISNSIIKIYHNPHMMDI